MEQMRYCVNIWILFVFYLDRFVTAFTLTGSSTNSTVGFQFILTCETSVIPLVFFNDLSLICTIKGANSNGTCQFDGSCNTGNYNFVCNTSNTYKLIIPGNLVTESLHGSKWSCGSSFGTSKAEYVLQVNVPVSSLTISSKPTDTNPIYVIRGREQTFACVTNAGRPSAKIQWFLSAMNLTGFAKPQPDVCYTDCKDGKVISSSELTYVGDLNDDGRTLHCTAVNAGTTDVRSSDKIIIILYGPTAIDISPTTQTYTLSEFGSIGPIKCSADCKPDCMMLWTGPNFYSGIFSVLNLRNITRNQSGNYQCTARNSISSLVSVNINIIVNYGPSQANISPNSPVYTVTDMTGSIGPIDCTADCNPECTMYWSGPYVPLETASVLFIQNISRQQAGEYRCTARNTVSSVQSTTVKVIVQWKPALNDGIVSSPVKMWLALGMFLNITINLIANPIPSIIWTFEQNNEIEDVSGTSYSIFNGINLSSTLLISSIESSQFGYYTCFARNSIGNFSQRFSVFKIDLPKAPDFVSVFCTTTTANLMWKSAVDEGAAHRLEVHYWKFGESARTSIKNISDPVFHFEQRITILDLNPDTQYRFLILSVNDIGSSSSEQVNCTTFSREEQGRELFYAGISTLSTGIVAIIVAVVIVFICRFQRKAGRSDNYIDLNTSNSEKMSAYSTIQEVTNFGTQTKNEDKRRKDSSIYDECQPPTSTVNG